LGGTLTHDTALSPFGEVEAIVLPAPLADSLGVTHFGQEATFQVDGNSVQVPLYAVLHRRQVGSLVASPVALSPLSFVQQATGLPGRLSRVLVQPAAGATGRVEAALERIAAGRVSVESTGYDQRLFAQAALASSHSTSLFSAISALVGFLFAFNAMLLTVPQRRRLAIDLRRDGYTPMTVVSVLLLDAVALGVLGCALGLVLGEELSIHLFKAEPAFLSLAFAIGTQRTVTVASVAIAVAGGMGAAIVAVLTPLRETLARDPLVVSDPGESRPIAVRDGWLALAGLACLAAATALLASAPQESLPAMVLLVGALLLMLPLALAGALLVLRLAAGLVRSPVGHVAGMELSSVRARAVAIAATGAVAVFGSVAIDGAHHDLLAGLQASARESNDSADLWVAPAGSYNLLHTAPFAPRALARLARLPGVRSVRVFRGGLLDYGQRRIRVIAPAVQSRQMIAASQVLTGDAAVVDSRLREGGWLTVSRALASEHGLHVGDAVELPTPRPTRLRVAAITTNLGWAPGAVVMSSATYARSYGSEDASALGVTLAPRASLPRVLAEVRHALGPGSGLAVQTASQQTARQVALSRQALARLTQIATLIPIIAVLAMAAAIGAMVWQRRPRLAKLKLEGIARGELWSTTLLESAVLLSAGCLSGAVFGLYGERLADRALAQAINFPVQDSFAFGPALASVLLVVGAALAVLALPGYLASSVPAALALQD
jgi:putative ABC transport system permease protein